MENEIQTVDKVHELAGHPEGTVLHGEKLVGSYLPRLKVDAYGDYILDENGELQHELDENGEKKLFFAGWHKEPVEGQN